MWSIDRCHHSVYCQSHRSCNGAASPTSQGSKSVRDFEEQTAALHKEIFNLKLKLFFMEESMPCYKQTQANGQDPLLKQLVDKKVEVEMMRKELLDNQQLLREGMDTINDLQTMISAREQKYQEDIEVLNHKISLFEMERELQQESKCLLEHVQSTANANNANATQQIEELQSKLKEADEKIEEFQSQISELDEILVARDEKIRNLEAQIDELKQQNANHMARLQQQTNEIESLGANVESLKQANELVEQDKQSLLQSYESMKCKFNDGLQIMTRSLSEKQDQEKQLLKMQSLVEQRVTITDRLMERISQYEALLKTQSALDLAKVKDHNEDDHEAADSKSQEDEGHLYKIVMRRFEKRSDFDTFVNHRLSERKNAATSTCDLERTTSPLQATIEANDDNESDDIENDNDDEEEEEEEEEEEDEDEEDEEELKANANADKEMDSLLSTISDYCIGLVKRPKPRPHPYVDYRLKHKLFKKFSNDESAKDNFQKYDKQDYQNNYKMAFKEPSKVSQANDEDKENSLDKHQTPEDTKEEEEEEHEAKEAFSRNQGVTIVEEKIHDDDVLNVKLGYSSEMLTPPSSPCGLHAKDQQFDCIYCQKCEELNYLNAIDVLRSTSSSCLNYFNTGFMHLLGGVGVGEGGGDGDGHQRSSHSADKFLTADLCGKSSPLPSYPSSDAEEISN